MARLRRGSRARAVAVAAFMVVTLLSACGEDDGGPSAMPSEHGAFVTGDFGDIPVHPLAEPAGPKSTTGDVVAQSFVARNVSRADLYDWYEDRLDGWDQVEPPQPLGDAPDAATRAQWVRDDRRLIMTVSEAPTLDGESTAGEDERLQYSLSLEPKDR